MTLANTNHINTNTRQPNNTVIFQCSVRVCVVTYYGYTNACRQSRAHQNRTSTVEYAWQKLTHLPESWTPVSRTPSKMESEQTEERSDAPACRPARGIDFMAALLSFIKRLRAFGWQWGEGGRHSATQQQRPREGYTPFSIYSVFVCVLVCIDYVISCTVVHNYIDS